MGESERAAGGFISHLMMYKIDNKNDDKNSE